MKKTVATLVFVATWPLTILVASQSYAGSIDLGTAGNFVILAKSGISSTTGTKVVGDIGVSPIAATGITGFGLIMDPWAHFRHHLW